jgi:trehalose 6-phosphate phosphatase
VIRHLLEEAEGELAALAARPRIVLAFDFDGTLSPIAPTPEAARIDAEADRALRELVSLRDPGLRIGVASGRTVERLRRLTPPVDFWIGLHGLEVAEGDGPPRTRFDTRDSDEAIERLRRRAGEFTRGGARLEDKGHALTLHVRGLSTDRAAAALAMFTEAVDAERRAGAPIAALHAHKAIEVRPDRAGKHFAIDEIRRAFDAALAFAGDDSTDEDVFRAFPDELCVAVMDPIRETAAKYYLRSPSETAEMLRVFRALRLASPRR